MKSRPEILGTLMVAAFMGSLAFSLSRLPHAVYYKRFRRIMKWREKKDIYSFFVNDLPWARDALEWVLENTKENTVILYEPSPGLRLFPIPRIIYPRLLVSKYAVRKGCKTACGREIATAPAPGGGKGFVVLKEEAGKLHVVIE